MRHTTHYFFCRSKPTEAEKYTSPIEEQNLFLAHDSEVSNSSTLVAKGLAHFHDKFDKANIEEDLAQATLADNFNSQVCADTISYSLLNFILIY